MNYVRAAANAVKIDASAAKIDALDAEACDRPKNGKT